MHYDPQLPILAELEDHIRSLALAAEAAPEGVPVGVPAALSAGSPAGAPAALPSGAPAGARAGAAGVSAGARHRSSAEAPHGSRRPSADAHDEQFPGAVGSTPPTGRGLTGSRVNGRAAAGARGTTGRLLRRGAVLALLGCTVGATATALDRASDRARDASPGVVASGAVGGAQWRLEVTRHEGRLCPALVVSGSSAPGAALSTDCVAAPTGTDVVPATALTAERVVVGGLTGPGVRAVRVTVGDRRRTVRTVALDAADGPRSFGVVLRRPRGGADVVPRVRPLDAERRSVGRAVRDCSAAPRATSCGR
jgi:hypothetical protein